MRNRKQTRKKENKRKGKKGKRSWFFYDRLFESTVQCGVMGSSPGSDTNSYYFLTLSYLFTLHLLVLSCGVKYLGTSFFFAYYFLHSLMKGLRIIDF